MPKNKNKEKFYAGLKIVIRHLAVYKKELIILSFLGVVSAITNGIIPYIAGRLIDTILKPSEIFSFVYFEMPFWLFLIILWFIVRLITDIIDWLMNLKSTEMDELVETGYIIKGYSALLEVTIAFHKDKKI